MANIKKIYSDIDLTFSKHPGKGDIILSYDEQAVIRSIRNLLLTNRYERPFQPEVGSNITALLFEPISPITAHAIEQEILTTIKNFEPRAQVTQINVDAVPDNNAFYVRIAVLIGNNTTPTAVNLLLERTR